MEAEMRRNKSQFRQHKERKVRRKSVETGGRYYCYLKEKRFVINLKNIAKLRNGVKRKRNVKQIRNLFWIKLIWKWWCEEWRGDENNQFMIIMSKMVMLFFPLTCVHPWQSFKIPKTYNFPKLLYYSHISIIICFHYERTIIHKSVLFFKSMINVHIHHFVFPTFSNVNIPRISMKNWSR